MIKHSTRYRALAAAVPLALVLAACGSSSDSDASPADAAAPADSAAPSEAEEQAEAPAEPEEPADAGLPLIAVGETFRPVGFVGTFEATYLGLADLGVITTMGGDDLHCYAILGEVTLVAEGEVPGPGLSPQRADALAADGAVIDAIANAECPQSATIDAGYSGAFSVDWAVGVAERISFDIVAVPVGAVDQLDRIQVYPAIPEFELVATVTETL